MDHPVFKKFRGYAGTIDPHIWIDWIGARFPRRLIAPFPTLEAEEFSHPVCSEEYFEWIDLLTAVAAAEHRFVMVELGAGFGRWGIRGAVAAKQRGIAKIDVRLVEAEPQHAEWARECIALNALSDVVTVTEAALCYRGKPTSFTIDGPDMDALSWYGQFIVAQQEPSAPTDEEYYGRRVYRHPGGYGQIFVPSLTLEELIVDLDRVDLLDVDIQGGEKELVENAIETMTAKITLTHIGTHSAEIENSIRHKFNRYGWKCRWDFSLGGQRDTPYGTTNFGDGIQGWVNPRLSHFRENSRRSHPRLALLFPWKR